VVSFSLSLKDDAVKKKRKKRRPDFHEVDEIALRRRRYNKR